MAAERGIAKARKPPKSLEAVKALHGLETLANRLRTDPRELEAINAPRGLETVPRSSAEVSGHALSGVWASCWHCETPNYVPENWDYFSCHKCHALNAI
jgi:hypothetical protein